MKLTAYPVYPIGRIGSRRLQGLVRTETAAYRAALGIFMTKQSYDIARVACSLRGIRRLAEFDRS